MSKPLTPKQEMFCKEYLVDLNATQAAIRAGYSEATAKEQGCQHLTKVNIQSRIQELMSVRSAKTEVTSEYVISNLKLVVERCLQKEQVMEFIDGEMVPSGEWKFEHSGVNKALELLGRHLKLFTDKIEHKGVVTLEQMLAGSNKENKDE